MQIGAQLLGRADAGPEAEDGSGAPEVPHPLFRQKPDGTLLAVVPIPGTGTSMAIVGYPVTAPGSINSPVRSRPAAAASGPRAAGGPAARPRPAPGLGGRGRGHADVPGVRAAGVPVGAPVDRVHPGRSGRQVWQRDFGADSRTVDVHVSRLRHKLGPSYGRYLVTEYRVGYQFRPAIG